LVRAEGLEPTHHILITDF